ncbi:MAG TPA: hypothetical protein VM577_03740 [Anaerovoracaceae bacterium]|nr:hypothetical protein [Anaerovoracaceae bacterium]
MADFPGGQNALPGPYSEVITQSRGVSVPGGTRIAAILGEGARVERLVSSAVGGGSDGLNSSYSSTNGSDGRHFLLSLPEIVSNRTQLFKNGIPLVGLEQSFTSSSGSFSSKYDYRIDITNGHIELQTAALVDQGGSFFVASSLNVGNGTINGLALVDPNAPTETWSVRCASVRRDGYGNPIDGYAKFVVQGSISGIILDGYGNQITWQSNGVTTTNGILSFSITEGMSAFREGDRFTIKVKGGALVRGDSLVAHYIAEIDLNDPEFFSDLDLLTTKHGAASLDNRLSLGSQLAFANGPPGVFACQAAPAIPRRVSYPMDQSASGGATADDLEFPLPLNVIPDVDSNIHFFITDPVTGVESQILPNKVAFYNSGYTASPNTFHFGSLSFSYTVVLEDSVTKRGEDGVVTSIGPTSATISSQLIIFDSGDVGKSLKVLHPSSDAGVYTIASVAGGVATISNGVHSFSGGTGVNFEVVDDDASSAQILFTQDLALSAGQALRVTVVDVKDAPFFDPGWQAALEAIEKIECDIVVPLPSQTISSIFQAARVHCETMSNIKNRKERILFIGAINGLKPENVTGQEPAAVEDIGVLEGIQGDDVSEILSGDIEDLTDYGVPNSFGNTFRVVFFYPDQIVVQIGADRVKVDGFFIAAAAAGFLSGIPNVAIPLTNKVLAGFTILRDKLFRPVILENLAAAGITSLQPAIGGGTVIWGKTTTQSGAPEEEEISIVFIRDRIAKSMRGAFAGFVGTAETLTLQGSLMARANSVLQSFISQGLITAFSNLKVIRDPNEPRQWNITVAVQPVYPVNWIYIRVGIGIL